MSEKVSAPKCLSAKLPRRKRGVNKLTKAKKLKDKKYITSCPHKN
jgi:hypothetical protein